MCAHCNSGEIDDSRHTLELCPEWSAERAALRAIIGPDLGNVVRQILYCKENWRAFSEFCGCVLFKKEVTERARQALDRGARIGHLDSNISDMN